MKLDPTALRYLSRDDFRVLTAVEMGMKNHDLVPKELITQIADLRHGGTDKMLQTLLRHKLLHHETRGFDGFRLTTLGYDYLALRAFLAKGVVSGVGTKIGVGKESDIFLVENEEGREMVLKLHRLGKTSFRKIKSKRDYHGKRGSPSWIYLSRLAAQKEYHYMKALHNAGFPVPEPIEANRHCVLMSLLQGYPLHSVGVMVEPEKCMAKMLELVVRMAKCGLIHGDFNEFNVAVSKTDSSDVVMYDFPQMVSMNHFNAKMYFDRDIDGVFRFFKLRFNVQVEAFDRPDFSEVFKMREANLDIAVGASGFSNEESMHFEELMDQGRRGERDGERSEEEGDEEEEDDEEEDENEDGEEEEAEEEQEEVEAGKAGEANEGENTPVVAAAATDDSKKEPEEEAKPRRPRKSGPVTEEARRKERVQMEVARLMKTQMRSGKTSRNQVKSRERRKVKESMNMDWS